MITYLYCFVYLIIKIISIFKMEKTNKYRVSWLCKTNKNDKNISSYGNEYVNSIEEAYELLKKQKEVVTYYDITTGKDWSVINSLVEWAGAGGYWNNMLVVGGYDAIHWHSDIVDRRKELDFWQ